jgi:hypothetical protein
LRSQEVALVHIPALSPLGERVARRRRFLQPVSRRGRVRGSPACDGQFGAKDNELYLDDGPRRNPKFRRIRSTCEPCQ